MSSYRPLVGWLHVGLGLLNMLPALILPLVFGGIFGVVAIGSKDPTATSVVGVTLGVILFVAMTVLLLSGALSLAAGVGILQRRAWGDALALVASVLSLPHFPLGTALGAFGLWVLLVREPSEQLGLSRSEPAPSMP